MIQSAFHRYEITRKRNIYGYGSTDSKLVFSHAYLSEPLCGWDWYKAQYNKEYPEPILEIDFDDKPLITINGNYKRGLIKLVMTEEIKKHHPLYFKYGHKKIFNGYSDDNVLLDSRVLV